MYRPNNVEEGPVEGKVRTCNSGINGNAENLVSHSKRVSGQLQRQTWHALEVLPMHPSSHDGHDEHAGCLVIK